MALSRDVTVRLVGEDKASSTFDKVGKSSGGLADKIGKLGAAVPLAGAAVAGLAAGAVSLAGSFVETSSRLELLAEKSKTVFGDSKGMVDRWAKTSATAMKLTRSEAVGLAAGFADLLVPMGFTREQAARMSTDTIGLAGALARWSNGTHTAESAAEALSDAMLGETDALKSLGINLSAADVQARLTANGQDQLTGAARRQAEALATQQLILENSVDAQRAAADGNVTLADRLGRLQTAFRNAWEELVIRLTPAAERFADWVATEGVAKLQEFGRWLEANRDGFIGFAQGALTGTATVARAFGDLVQTGAFAAAAMLDQAATLAGAFGMKGLQRDLRGAAADIAVTGANARIALDKAADGADTLALKLNGLKDKRVTVTVDYREVGGITPRQAERQATPLRRAEGGPVYAGRAYTVGERRAETFIPSTNGMIVPRRLGSAGGGITVNFTGPVYGTNSDDLAEKVRATLVRMQRNGTQLGLA
jgi:hypothetical protein